MNRLILPLLAGALLLAGCGPRIPEQFRASYDAMKREVEDAEASYRRAKKDMEVRMRVNAVYASAAPLIGAPALMKEAEGDIKAAEKILRGELAEAARDKSPEGPLRYRKAGSEIDELLEDAEESFRRPSQAFDLANRYLSSRPDARALYASMLEPVKTSVGALAGDTRGAQKKHPAKKDDLERRLSEFRTALEGAEKAAGELTDSADAPQFVAALERTDRLTTQAMNLGRDLAARVNQLDRSYTKTLIDMRADYDVVFGRSSWSSYSDYDREASYTYPPQRLGLQEYARLVQDPGRSISQFDAANLGLDIQAGRSTSHNEAEFWVEDTREAFFHRYLITENGRSTETDWVPVDASLFAGNLENLGMDILTKPEGIYEEDALLVPVPPGFAYVNNRRCGRWVNRPEGRVWEWNDRCGGYRGYYGRWYPSVWILYSDWDRWNRGMKGKTPYYGPGNVFGTYGSGGSSTFRGTNWGQFGSLNRQDPSLRGLAGTWRGGGPGGGGK